MDDTLRPSMLADYAHVMLSQDRGTKGSVYWFAQGSAAFDSLQNHVAEPGAGRCVLSRLAATALRLRLAPGDFTAAVSAGAGYSSAGEFFGDEGIVAMLGLGVGYTWR